MPQHELLACAQCGCFAFSCFEDFAIRVKESRGLVGLGTPWGFRRFVISVDGLMSVLLNGRDLRREIPAFRRRNLALACLPFYPLFLLVLLSFIIYHAAILVGITPSATMQHVYPWLDLFAIAWVFPNYLRQAALQIVSSNCHYYDDIGNITEETQVLRPFYLVMS